MATKRSRAVDRQGELETTAGIMPAGCKVVVASLGCSEEVGKEGGGVQLSSGNISLAVSLNPHEEGDLR